MPTQLLGPDGKPFVFEHAHSFASVYNAFNRTYSYRYDEALRADPQNALAMRRDAYMRSLLQERMAPSVNRKWQIEIDNDKDAKQIEVRDRVTKLVAAVPRWRQVASCLLEALWYGRYGVQVEWGQTANGTGILRHLPVNGDKIQYQFDGTPTVMLYGPTADEIGSTDPDAVVTTDRGGRALRLYRQEWRDRFLIHKHLVDDADYFEGEMAGGVHGMGLRSLAYWCNWLRLEAMDWMLSFIQSVGMTDLLIFNYEEGNPAAKRAAEENARKITGKMALAVPRKASDRSWPAVESVPANSDGVRVLMELITDHYKRDIERLFVGQSMSAGADAEGSLGGSGRAEFAKDTKSQLLEWDAGLLEETITTDLVGPMVRFNFPGVDFPVRFKFIVPDAESSEKLGTGLKLAQAGVPLKADELRSLGGFTKPGDGDETAGGQQPAVGGPGGTVPGRDPNAPPIDGGMGGDDNGEPSLADLYNRLGYLEGVILYDSHGKSRWLPHTIQSGPRKGQQAFLNPATGELRDSPPDNTPGIVGRTKQAIGDKGRDWKAAASERLKTTLGGRAIRAIGRSAEKAFWTVEHALMKSMNTTQTLAAEAAKERGLSDEHVETVSRILVVTDLIAGYGAAYVAAGAGSSVAGPVGSAVGMKLGGFMPTASVAYLAYSTARNPLATWRAAKRLVKAELGKFEEGKPSSAEHHDRGESSNRKRWAGELLDLLDGSEDPDRTLAILYASLGMCRGDMERATKLTIELAGEDDEPTTFSASMPPEHYDRGAHKFSYVGVPLTGKVAESILGYGWIIPEESLHEKGLETEPHITARYGLHDEEPDEVRRLLQGTGSVKFWLGGVSVFLGAESGKPFDVIKVDVVSPELEAMHRYLGTLPHTDTHAEYHPHATIAYVKAGLGADIAAKLPRLDEIGTANEVVFSNTGGEKTTISLTGERIKHYSHNFDESKIKRDDGGKFAEKEGSGGNSSSHPTSDTSTARSGVAAESPARSRYENLQDTVRRATLFTSELKSLRTLDTVSVDSDDQKFSTEHVGKIEEAAGATITEIGNHYASVLAGLKAVGAPDSAIKPIEKTVAQQSKVLVKHKANLAKAAEKVAAAVSAQRETEQHIQRLRDSDDGYPREPQPIEKPDELPDDWKQKLPPRPEPPLVVAYPPEPDPFNEPEPNLDDFATDEEHEIAIAEWEKRSQAADRASEAWGKEVSRIDERNAMAEHEHSEQMEKWNERAEAMVAKFNDRLESAYDRELENASAKREKEIERLEEKAQDRIDAAREKLTEARDDFHTAIEEMGDAVDEHISAAEDAVIAEIDASED